MSPDIDFWRSQEATQNLRLTEKLTPVQKSDVIKMARVDAILEEEFTQEGLTDEVQGSITIEITQNIQDTLIISYSPQTGFHDQWKPYSSYLEVRDRIVGFGQTITQFFSHFPDNPDSDQTLQAITSRIEEVIEGEPTKEELQRLPAILAKDYRRRFIADTRYRIEEGNIWSIPRDLEELKKDLSKTGFVIEAQLEQDIMREYHLKRRELDLAKLPKVRGDVMRKMDPFIDRIIESDNYLREEHSEFIKGYAGRGAMQALRVIRDFVPFGLNQREKAQNRVSQFKSWRERALKWSKAAGIDITQELEALAIQIEVETKDDLKPTPRRLLDGLHRRVAGKVEPSNALVSKPELGPEDREIEPAYQDDITVLLKTKSGRVIGAQLRNDMTNQDFRIVFPSDSFTKEEILAALAKTFPGAEVYRSLPDFISAQNGAISIGANSDNDEFSGIRIPLEKERPVGGSKVRALWLTVRDGESHSFEADTLASPDGPVQDIYFPYDKSLSIKIEGEFNATGTYVLGEGWILHGGYHPLSEAEWSDLHQKLGIILEHLLENGNVIDDSIESISIHPGWGSPFRTEDLIKKEGYHLEEEEEFITVRDSQHVETRLRQTIRDRERGKFVFKDGEDQFGIINSRTDYLIRDLYTLVKFYSDGLSFNELAQEIEKLRVM